MTRYILKTLIPRFDFRWGIIRLHVIPMIVVLLVVMAFYYASQLIPVGWGTYAMSTFTVAGLFITALARLNDIPHTNTDARWQVRRGGLILVIMACFSLVAAPVISWVYGKNPDFPSWREVIMRVGVLAVWVTTPMMPPWHRYISGEFRKMRVEVPDNVQLDIVRTEATSDGSMFTERRKEPREEGP